MGKAPTQAPTTVQATVICRHVSHTDIALEPERQSKAKILSMLNSETQHEHEISNIRAKRLGGGAQEAMERRLPVPTEHSYPGLHVGAEDTETPQCG